MCGHVHVGYVLFSPCGVRSLFFPGSVSARAWAVGQAVLVGALLMSSVYNTLHKHFVENMLGFECWQSINRCMGSVKYHPGSIGSAGASRIVDMHDAISRSSWSFPAMNVWVEVINPCRTRIVHTEYRDTESKAALKSITAM